MPAGVHTAKRISDVKRDKIVNAFAAGESKLSIRRQVQTSDHIVNIVLAEEWQAVAKRKEILAAQAEANAMKAGEQIAKALDEGKIPINSLVPVYGVSMDKAIALRNDPTQINLNVTGQVQHAHSANAIFDRLNELADKLNAEAKAKRKLTREESIQDWVENKMDGQPMPTLDAPTIAPVAQPNDAKPANPDNSPRLSLPERSRMPLESFYDARPLS